VVLMLSTHAAEGTFMSDKSPQKANVKKQGKTLKEKRAAKRMKRIRQADHRSNFPVDRH
jgi:hypothetical protein